MERDKKMEKIIRESGLMSPSANFTESVLKKISTETIKGSYQPLIGKRAGYIVISVLVLFLFAAIFSTENGEIEPLFNLPNWNLSLSQWKNGLPEFNLKIPSVVLAGILALFLLVLSDAGFRKSKS